MKIYFAHNIRHVRTSWPLSQPKFARMFGVTTRQVQNWEAGISLPTIPNAIKIVKVLKKMFTPVSIDRLLFKELKHIS